MEVQNRLNCPVCGGFDFMKENGYFYCVECQTQCEGICEQVFQDQDDNDDEEKLIGTPFVSKKRKRKERKKRKGEDFTSWEMLNFALRGLVDELILFGVHESLGDTVLQLWAFYLQKCEIAFFSKDERTLPKLGVRYCDKDAELLYGLKGKKSGRRRRSTLLDDSVCANVNTSVCTLEDWSSQKINKSIKKKAKKALMGKVAELSLSETADTESTRSSWDQTSGLDESAFDNSLSVSSMSLPVEYEPITPFKLQRSKAAQKLIAKRGDETARYSMNLGINPKTLTRMKLVVFLYLALLYEGSTIQISDLIRWVREGHLSYHEAAKHLPESCIVQGRYHTLFRIEEQFPSYAVFLETSELMSRFLEMRDWPLPSASEITKKYVTELQLPEMFCELVERFVALVPFAYNKNPKSDLVYKINLPNYEGSILAIIIIILKLLFGLDGRTEHQISKVASQLNIFLKKKKTNEGTSKPLFVWKDWVQQLICRSAVLSRYHFSTKQVLCQEAFGNPVAFINHCKNWSDDNAGFDDKYNLGDACLLKVVHPALLNTLTSVLEKLQDPASCKNENIKFPQCCTPYSLYIKKIIEKSAQMDTPLIAKPALDALTQDFSKCDITYLLQPESMVNLASSHGQKLKIKNKSAQKKLKIISLKKGINAGKINPGMYKSKIYVSVTRCKLYNKKGAGKARENGDGEILEMNKRRMKEQSVRKKKKRKKKEERAKETKSEKIKKRSMKSKNSKALKSGSAKHCSHLCSKTRKRKEEMLPSGNSKKIKLSKLLKLYVPSSAYWIHYVEETLKEGEFDTHVIPKFPFSFSWLLSECAFVSEMSRFSVYKEVLRIERHCEYLFK